MAFFGKTYVFDRDEKYEDFVDSLPETTPEVRTGFKSFKPNVRLDKNADGTYTLTITAPERTLTIAFTDGVEFDENIAGRVSKTTITLNGNVLNQIQKYDGGNTITYKREFFDSELKQTITASFWNGEAHRYYRAK